MNNLTDLALATRINEIVTKCAYIDSRMTTAEVQVFNEAARRLGERSEGVDGKKCGKQGCDEPATHVAFGTLTYYSCCKHYEEIRLACEHE